MKRNMPHVSVTDLVTCLFSYYQQELGKTWEDIQNETEEEEYRTDSSAGDE